MNKDPRPKADGLRAMREATRGHLQATAETSKIDRPIPIRSSAVAGYVDGATGAPITTKVPASPPKRLIPYAGKDRSVQASGGIPFSKNPKPDGSSAPRKRVKHKRKIT